MVDRRDLGSWLEGPGVDRDVVQDHPGQRLGMPATGSGSIARLGRRVLGLGVDWALCLAIVAGFGGSGALAAGNSFAVLGVLALEHVLLVGTGGATVGHRVAGLRVHRLDGQPVGLPRAAARAVLLCLVIPAVVWDADQRGLHDKASGTVLLRR